MSIPSHLGESVMEMLDGHCRVEDTAAPWGAAAYSWEDPPPLKLYEVRSAQSCNSKLEGGEISSTEKI